MTVLSKMLHVCRPHEMFGPANQCNIRSGDVHFWLNQSGEIIDPTPLNESHPQGENVYIPWKTVPSSILPPPNGEMCTYDSCWQNVSNVMHLYPNASIQQVLYHRSNAAKRRWWYVMKFIEQSDTVAAKKRKKQSVTCSEKRLILGRGYSEKRLILGRGYSEKRLILGRGYSEKRLILGRVILGAA